MGPSSRPPQKGRRLVRDLRRAELIEAAIGVLRARGDVGARVADVTRAARVAKGTFYVHFDSWDQLVLAVRERLSHELEQRMMRRAKDFEGGSWMEFLEGEAVIFVNAMVAMGPLRDVVLYGRQGSQSAADAPVVKTIRALIKLATRDRALANSDCEIVGTLLFSAWRGAVDAIVANGQRSRHLSALRQMMHGWLSYERPSAE